MFSLLAVWKCAKNFVLLYFLCYLPSFSRVVVHAENSLSFQLASWPILIHAPVAIWSLFSDPCVDRKTLNRKERRGVVFVYPSSNFSIILRDSSFDFFKETFLLLFFLHRLYLPIRLNINELGYQCFTSNVVSHLLSLSRSVMWCLPCHTFNCCCHKISICDWNKDGGGISNTPSLFCSNWKRLGFPKKERLQRFLIGKIFNLLRLE